MMPPFAEIPPFPTDALKAAIATAHDATLIEDLVYLECWERRPQPGVAAARRILQLRRANPALAAAIQAEIAGRRQS